ncbi:hypothetical protein NDU88_001205 [Pleurodeles waltl]|uniref:Uncharacterized protein n=1 Tax=Pleurodeles waltl TaxID=8319 RepID=A0AAV7MKV1_PLEWA|nr:hypothetical protein NDU88_001205 [Pleurodeles waltl]
MPLVQRDCRRKLRPAGELPQHWEVSLVGADASRLRYAAAILLSVTNPLDTKGLQGLQWEYSKDDLTLYDNGEKQPNPVSLETIYQSIMEHREESKLESRRTRMACRKMQIQIRRVAKTCSEFTTRMEEAETRISRLDDEAGARQSSREMMEKQLEDTQWKLTDLEDRMRRNNLRVLGLGSDKTEYGTGKDYGLYTSEIFSYPKSYL